MKLEGQASHLAVVSGPFVPPHYPGAEEARDEAIRELQDLWSDTVDLAKRPGVLRRLHALLNA
ncbi:hypothetical protein R5H32_12235 [Defluviimonas sp. D31]|uniref:hypothetical protein n=1 Tax=Defluviimonas sp. D31 TaxID=3083253 RepID=UPI00296E941B|nr:hypothetical protein [Defluviimonas sp. D31]MDW4550122.1 hypothetical protein [Defluviimonas sp. D31]